ncbi:RICIN domain-containing protein [Dactylosporangium sucinum]|uniref:Uncharacterized protein n=1 Tax=Dactylosporangium sucinum TaxID=1424081 RepID=A0A917T092_9ACTN|nr:RICIN domain-containing protein [Dactylosporangium sucinum]GGM06239.1 hypothetical protein GCM10007977_004300 [Dactylosporangium sucinum]
MRRIALLVAAAVTALVGAVWLPAAEAATVDPSAWYVLVNRNSGKAMDLWEWSTADGGRISQYTDTDGYNSIATNGGTISGGGEVRLAERTEFPGNADITLRNFTLTNNRIVENPCADRFTISGVTLNNSTISRC